MTPFGVVLILALAFASDSAAATSRRVALFGDSNSAFVLQDGNPLHLSNFGYFNWINRVLGAPFDLVLNAGVAGNDTRQMRTRYERDLLLRVSDYDVVFLLAGVNDVRHGLSPSEAAENLRFFAEDQERRGKSVMLTLPQPVGWANPIVTNGMVPSTEEARSRYAELRRLVLAWTSTLTVDRRIIVCDPFATLADPDSQNGDMDPRLSSDQVHFAAPAGLRYAQAIRNILAARLFISNEQRPFTGPNLLANPDLRVVSRPSLVGGVEPADFGLEVSGGTRYDFVWRQSVDEANSGAVGSDAKKGIVLAPKPAGEFGPRPSLILSQTVRVSPDLGRVRGRLNVRLEEVSGLSSIGLAIQSGGKGAGSAYDGWTGWDTLPLEAGARGTLTFLTPWLTLKAGEDAVTWRFLLRWSTTSIRPGGEIHLGEARLEADAARPSGR